jgi:glycosyltransferase involved in cell wall biosynthesis
MKILFVQNYWTPYRNALFNELNKNYEVEVLYLSKIDSARKWKKEDCSYKYVELDSFNIGFLVVSRNLTDFEVFGFDICVMGEMIFNAVSLLQLKKKLLKCNVRTIIWSGEIHERTYTSLLRNYITTTLKKVFRSSLYNGISEFWAYSTKTFDMIYKKKHMQASITVIPQAINIEIPMMHRYEPPNDVIRFIFVGYFRPEKNLKFLLDVFSELREDLNLELLLIGSGDSTLQIYESSRIKFKGYLDKEAKVSVMQTAHVLILPSLREPWGLVVNEALALGMPVALSTSVGATDMVDKNGVVFHPNNKDELKNAIEFFIKNKENIARMSKRSLEIYQGYTIERAAAVVSEVFSQ